ncbi:MAG: DEAD/DEAH box helicase [Caulobacterales bacterium]
MTQFQDLGLAAPILKALAADNYTQPTPIQLQAIPSALAGRDIVGLAQTGTGKTAAFALPILQRFAEKKEHIGARACRALVLAPTRELAAQIGESFRAYGRYLGLSTAVVFGGASMGKQVLALQRGVDVLVATPGRLLDHVQQRTLTLGKVEVLVVDEADHMMDMGFIQPLRRIADLLPKQRQTLFFSATMPPQIKELANRFLTDPVEVAVTPVASTAERVEQAVIHVETARKNDLLDAILRDPAVTRAIVFARTKHGANRIAEKMADVGHAVEAIHGNKSQGQRERALENFRKGRVKALIATEIAARGIDVDDVSHVINVDLPNVPEQYVHRIGRTARAGQAGLAISFCAPDERAYLRDIERLTKQKVPVMDHPLGMAAPAPGAAIPPPPKQGQRGRPGGFTRPQGHSRPPHRERGERNDRGPPKAANRDQGARESGARDNAARDTGDRRDRKGNDVWSNGPARAPSRSKAPGRPGGGGGGGKRDRY